MGETRKIAAILVADVVGYSRLAGADEDRTLARLWALAARLCASMAPRTALMVIDIVFAGRSMRSQANPSTTSIR
jgi:class 3 adenylate cyclase